MATEITVHVSPKSAILARTRAGKHVISVDLDSWYDEDCAQLAAMVGADGTFEREVAPPTQERLLWLVREGLERERLKAEANERERQELLAAPIDSLLTARSEGWVAHSENLEGHYNAAAIEERRPDVQAELLRRNAERREEGIRQKAAAAAALEESKRARAEWIMRYGSPRLQACLAEGFECEAIYRDERDAQRREWVEETLPGWCLYQDIEGIIDEDGPRNPPAEALETLTVARKQVEAAGLAGQVTLEYVDRPSEIEPYYCAYLDVSHMGVEIGVVLLPVP